jgi:HAD superfamily hydrolase (TIGR01549 family)
MLKGIFLDLCGTILTYGDMDAAWADWLETGYDCFHQAGWPGAKSQFEKACDGLFSLTEPPRADDGLTVYERRLKRLAEKAGCSLNNDQLRRAAMATVCTWADRMYLEPGVLEILKTLQERYCLALISNYDHPPYIEMALDRLRLRPFFSQVIISSQVGLSKPDPRIFELALKKSKLKADEVIFVGDSLKDDIAGARAAGIRPVFLMREPEKTWVASGYRSTAAQKQVLPDNSEISDVETIGSLSELLKLI